MGKTSRYFASGERNASYCNSRFQSSRELQHNAYRKMFDLLELCTSPFRITNYERTRENLIINFIINNAIFTLHIWILHLFYWIPILIKIQNTTVNNFLSYVLQLEYLLVVLDIFSLIIIRISLEWNAFLELEKEVVRLRREAPGSLLPWMIVMYACMISRNNIRNTSANLLRSEAHKVKEGTWAPGKRREEEGVRRSNGTMTKTSLNFRRRLEPCSLVIVILT